MWRNRNVWIILLGEFVVGLGLWAGIIGNLAFMQEVVPSDFHKSLIIACGILAGLVVGPMAGRIIDQSKKKNSCPDGEYRTHHQCFIYVYRTLY